ncbi:porin family protein [Algoriphagus machipongonensis]|uniref:Outer membrane protein beta-barrel domain-containing protein n=1 Tax=Algoriphagus machipongonensis TaxID=388413 RepID=A3I037_9BACT|nr:hypothetical protein [Algoriphagus machipongonensis]EAZ79833.1 hypothetical protein ALPR1_14429 [Algoriphagus machipongonensis]
MSEKPFDKSDKELDDLLKEIVEKADIPFSEGDWNDMQARLDDDSNKPGGWNAKGLLLGGILLIGGLLGYFLLNAEDASENTLLGKSNIESTSYIEKSKEEITKLNPKQSDEQVKESFVTKLAISDVTISNPDEAYEKENKSNEPSQSGLYYGLKTPLNVQSLPNFARTTSFGLMKNEQVIQKQLEAFDISQREVQTAFNKKNKEKFGGVFNISAQVAPDLSGIKMDQMERVGNAFGIGVEYFIKPKISLNSGLFYSYKPYSGTNGYETAYGQTPPSYVLGVCDILDIPINLRVYPFEDKVQRIFGSVGVSSYLMLKEHYELTYEDGSGYPYYDEINVRNKNNHFFGVANFSIGYERKLGKQLSIQVEPYYKVPFQGVGEGNVSLKSTGIFVGLKFYPKAAN